MSSADIANMQISEFDFSDEMDNLALTNELLKARAAGQVMGSNVSTNVVDNSNNSTTVQEEVILDPKVNDYNFMTSAASDY